VAKGNSSSSCKQGEGNHPAYAELYEEGLMHVETHWALRQASLSAVNLHDDRLQALAELMIAVKSPFQEHLLYQSDEMLL
jgi:hypothetical protein